MYGLVANILDDRVLRTGAKVWIDYCNGDAECPIVIGMSKSGRIVKKYTHFKRLIQYRAAWIPAHMESRLIWHWETKAEATEHATRLATMWAGIRQYSRDGKVLLYDGAATSEAFRR